MTPPQRIEVSLVVIYGLFINVQEEPSQGKGSQRRQLALDSQRATEAASYKAASELYFDSISFQVKRQKKMALGCLRTLPSRDTYLLPHNKD